MKRFINWINSNSEQVEEWIGAAVLVELIVLVVLATVVSYSREQ